MKSTFLPSPTPVNGAAPAADASGGIRIVGVLNEEPFAPTSWSGSSFYFFSALKESGALYAAVSAQPPAYATSFYKLLSFHPNLSTWRERYHLNTHYYDHMTRTACQRVNALDAAHYEFILQVGAWYDLTCVRRKRVVSYHDGNLACLLKSPWKPASLSRSLEAGALAYERQVYRHLHHLFPMSRWLADSFMRDFDVPAAKLTPVGAGINFPFVPRPQERGYHGPHLLFVGRQFERKGGKILLEAFHRVRREMAEARLTIIGPPAGEAIPGVRWLGEVSKATPQGLTTLVSAYTEASVFVLPSLYEPFGIAFAEAMAHCLPCVGTRTCAIPEIIAHGQTGLLVPVGDTRALATALLSLLRNPDQCYAFGRSGYDRFQGRFRWDVVARKIVETLTML